MATRHVYRVVSLGVLTSSKLAAEAYDFVWVNARCQVKTFTYEHLSRARIVIVFLQYAVCFGFQADAVQCWSDS